VTDLKVKVEERDDEVTLALEGELDISSTPRLEAELGRVEAAKPHVVILDLRDLAFLDSSGLRAILEADMRARREGRRVALIPGPETVHRVFLIALLDKRLEFIEPPGATERREEEG
jgi:anti-sigma B factor antagonist